MICEGPALPSPGPSSILPALAATGLVDTAEAVYGPGGHISGAARAAFYGIRSLLLSIVFACLLGEPGPRG